MLESTLEKKPEGLLILEGFVSLFTDLLFKTKLYSYNEKYLGRLTAEAQQNLEEILRRKNKLTFRYMNGHLYLNNFRVDMDRRKGKGRDIFHNAIERMNMREIEIQEGVREDELRAFAEICVAADREDRSADMSEMWGRIRRIRITNRGVISARKHSNRRVEPQRAADPSSTRKGVKEVGGAIGHVLKRLHKIELGQARNAGKRIINLISDGEKYYYAVLLLKSLKSFDEYTFNHSVNVCVIATSLASSLGFSEAEKDRLGIAALLHDIGKTYVPKKIITKKDRLTPVEWQHIKKHPVNGARILKEEGGDSFIQRIAYEHHLRFDMKGYPALSGNYKVLDESFIVQIADSYDALTTRRPYRKQLSPFEAVSFMQKKRGTEFHPNFIDIFMTTLGNLPIGSMVTLDSGEKALIVDIHTETGKFPAARIIKDSEGRQVKGEVIIDLNEKDPRSGTYLRSIKSVADNPLRDVEIGEYTMGRK